MKCHVNSESHVRQMRIVGENPQKYIQEYSTEFQSTFVGLLRTSHGEKWISVNRFYNEFIRDKEHIHMNSTRWNSLTEFAKHLGREGIVHVRENEKDGVLEIAWRDTSAAAVKRREEIREQELAELRNGAGEEKMLKKMSKRAQDEADEKARILEARKAVMKKDSPLADDVLPNPEDKDNSTSPPSARELAEEDRQTATVECDGEVPKTEAATPAKFSFGLKTKTTLPAAAAGQKRLNVFKRARAEDEGRPKKKLKL